MISSANAALKSVGLPMRVIWPFFRAIVLNPLDLLMERYTRDPAASSPPCVGSGPLSVAEDKRHVSVLVRHLAHPGR